MDRWSKEERQIFGYEDGNGRVAYADPLEVRRRLANLLGDPARVLNEARSSDDDLAERAIKKLRIACCDIFSLGKPFDRSSGEGVTDATWIRVLDAYLGWAEKNVVPVVSEPSSSRPSDTASPVETAPSPT